MRKPKYKIGDRVRITRASTEEEYDLWWDCWNREMTLTINRVVTICFIDMSGKRDGAKFCKYAFKETDYNYPEFVLEPEVKVGDQLLFPFMSE